MGPKGPVFLYDQHQGGDSYMDMDVDFEPIEDDDLTIEAEPHSIDDPGYFGTDTYAGDKF